MALKRINNPNHARFLTFSTFRKTTLFDSPSLCDDFVCQLQQSRVQHGILLYAWVIMPDHIHLLLREPKSGDVEVFLRTLKTGFAKKQLFGWRKSDPDMINRLTSPKGQVRFWQRGGGYDRNVFSESEFEEKVQYIHMNPVRSGLVGLPCDWVWSSARFWSGEEGCFIACDHR